MRLLTGAFVLALLPLAGCSQDEPEPEPAPAPAASSRAPLARSWEHDLELPPNSYPDPVVVSQRHWLSSASLDSSPGTTNPTPNVPLPYTIGDSETGEVSTLPSLGLGPVLGIPGTDLVVAVAGGRVGVIDPAVPEIVWSRHVIGREAVGLSPTRIWTGHTCLTVETGREVRREAECRAARATEDETSPEYVVSDLGPVWVDYRGDQAMLRLLDVRTGEVAETLGTVRAGTLVGFAGDVAVFEERYADSPPKVSGYRVGS